MEDLREISTRRERAQVSMALTLSQVGLKALQTKAWGGTCSKCFRYGLSSQRRYLAEAIHSPFPENIHILHSLPKKPPQGIATPEQKPDLISRGLNVAYPQYSNPCKKEIDP